MIGKIEKIIIISVLLTINMFLWPYISSHFVDTRDTGVSRLCESNLRDISLALVNYAVSNNNAYPEDLYVLIEDGSINAKQLVCPKGDLKLKEVLAMPISRERFKVLMAKSSYVYVSDNIGPSSDPEDIIMYEKPHPHYNDEYIGMNILFGDGSVNYHLEEKGIALLKKQGVVVQPYKKKGWW